MSTQFAKVLSGEIKGSVVHTAFPKSIIIGTPTTRGALIDLEQNIFENVARIEILESSKDDNNQDIADINSDLTDLEVSIVGTKTDVSNLQVRVSDAETTIIDHEQRILANETAVGELSKREFFLESLGFTVAYRNPATAAAGGVAIGDVYVQSPSASLTDGVLKTRMS